MDFVWYNQDTSGQHSCCLSKKNIKITYLWTTKGGEVMEKFCIENYKGMGNMVAMHCIDEESASVFLSYLDSTGRTWRSGDKYDAEKTYFNDYSDGILYYFDTGSRGSAMFPLEDMSILAFDDFDWSEFGYTRNIKLLDLGMSFNEMFYGYSKSERMVTNGEV
jgi:hypothetical protein